VTRQRRADRMLDGFDEQVIFVGEIVVDQGRVDLARLREQLVAAARRRRP